MFTGIVQEIGSIVNVSPGKLIIGGENIVEGLQNGASIAVNGVCLTVTNFDAHSFSVDVQPETLRRTNLGKLKPGDPVNLERALKLNGELGGHIVQGHIDDTGTVIERTPEGKALRMRFAAPSELLRYIVPRGFIAIDGTSLTVTEVNGQSFGVSLIPFTQELSVVFHRRIGDTVNLEVDIIGKYVESLLKQKSGGITEDFLREHGFYIE